MVSILKIHEEHGTSDEDNYCDVLKLSEKESLHCFNIVNGEDFESKLCVGIPDVDSIQILVTRLQFLKMEFSFSLNLKMDNVKGVGDSWKMFRSFYQDDESFKFYKFYETKLGDISLNYKNVVLYIGIDKRLVSESDVSNIVCHVKWDIVQKCFRALRNRGVTFAGDTFTPCSSKTDKGTYLDPNSTLKHASVVLKDEWLQFATSVTDALLKYREEFNSSLHETFYVRGVVNFFFGFECHGLRSTTIDFEKYLDNSLNTELLQVNDNTDDNNSVDIGIDNSFTSRSNSFYNSASGESIQFTETIPNMSINVHVGLEFSSKIANSAVLMNLKNLKQSFSWDNANMKVWNHALGIEDYGHCSITETRKVNKFHNLHVPDFELLDEDYAEKMIIEEEKESDSVNDCDCDCDIIDNNQTCVFSMFHDSAIHVKAYEIAFKLISNVAFEPWVSCLTNNFGEEPAACSFEGISATKSYPKYHLSLVEKKYTYLSQMEEYLKTRKDSSSMRLEIIHNFTDYIDLIKWIKSDLKTEKWSQDLKTFLLDGAGKIKEKNINNINNASKRSQVSKECSDYGILCLLGYNRSDQMINDKGQLDSISAYTEYVTRVIDCRFQLVSLLLSFTNNNQDLSYSFNSYNLMKNFYPDILRVLHVIHQQLLFYTRGMNGCDLHLIENNTFNCNIRYSFFCGILRWKNDEFIKKVYCLLKKKNFLKEEVMRELFLSGNYKEFHVLPDYGRMVQVCQFTLMYYDLCFPKYLLQIIMNVLQLAINVPVDNNTESRCRLFVECVVECWALYGFLLLNCINDISSITLDATEILKVSYVQQLMEKKYIEFDHDLLVNDKISIGRKVLVSQLWKDIILEATSTDALLIKNAFLPIIFHNCAIDVNLLWREMEKEFTCFLKENCEVWPNIHFNNFSQITKNLAQKDERFANCGMSSVKRKRLSNIEIFNAKKLKGLKLCKEDDKDVDDFEMVDVSEKVDNLEFEKMTIHLEEFVFNDLLAMKSNT